MVRQDITPFIAYFCERDFQWFAVRRYLPFQKRSIASWCILVALFVSSSIAMLLYVCYSFILLHCEYYKEYPFFQVSKSQSPLLAHFIFSSEAFYPLRIQKQKSLSFLYMLSGTIRILRIRIRYGFLLNIVKNLLVVK